ncbi:MAG: hypothetical protein OYH76_24550 [Defluviicoccus sp.]|nr:hypothetical protein [Defluviicoccus sp.]MDE0279079.1 hypothetical protein [Defluviicoccus sp.]
MSRANSPDIKWEDGTWFVTLPLEDGKTTEAGWKPGLTFVVRIREAGSGDWSFGFETPITSFTVLDLEPDTVCLSTRSTPRVCATGLESSRHKRC